jgi:polysaccharide biosynthesis protein PslG
MRRALVPLVLGGLLYLVAVVLIFAHESKMRAPGLGLAPLPAKTCAGPLVGVNSTLAYIQNARYRAESVQAIGRLLGAQVVRDSLLWDRVEAVRGRRDWTSPDNAVKQLRAAGIEPLLAVFGSPSWANGVPASKTEHNLYVPAPGPAFDAWLQHYANFVAAAVRRYRGVVHRWEIWNEPNLEAFWRPRADPEAYRRLYVTLRAAILKADPRAEVAVGGITALGVAPGAGMAGPVFLRRFMRGHPPVDVLAVHTYPRAGPTVDRRGQDNFGDILRIHDQLIAAGYSVPLWLTEWGWSTKLVGDRRQARFVDQSLKLLQRRYRFVRLATYFTDHDLPPRFFQGLLTADLRPKPAARAFRAQARGLAARCRRG